MKTIYMDNNATTQVDPAVFEEMKPFFTELYGNPSSMHRFGGQVGVKLKEARESVAALLGCDVDEIIFTSCGSESDNTAIRSALNAQPNKRHIITTRVEHPAILSLCKFLEKKEGYAVTYLGTDEHGRLDLDEYRQAFRDDTAIVSVMWANNETGNIYPVEEMAKIAKEHGVFFHTDAVQAVGKIPVDLKSSAIDMLSLSGHKLHAPKGVGALYVRKRLPFRPFLIGGHQERSRRAGTENTTGIIALGKACQLALENMEAENTIVKNLRDKLEKGLLETIPDSILNGDKDNRLPNTSNISFGYVEGEAILLMMDQVGICASSGSACTSGSLEPSHVLRAMGVPFTFAHGSIRFSLSRFNTEEEIDFVLETMPKLIENLRKLSPFSAEKELPTQN
ncbi:cysteine desulfurase (tRNA sulfurtransferase), PLP-dependent [Pseudodesulfovibrio profundus]|uniref:Cysteine desulfurase n=1 Tax=Pseudodesulfovibrio profundus TaxID=57320 RepID=A0A2C8F6D3_9BACT|nr:cysteine desulfurase NifS [Pseudodesulfovibrio profundus]SOB57685.1 cysteine desulfurase (tRNA sulfurtransferase), PLP-dependent [Pseudodesulfovibrio profundus]|tara:strand:+ start:7425 stop:8606 length:1182 start_codon:yes stop_codon:yes gene_type:complete